MNIAHRRIALLAVAVTASAAMFISGCSKKPVDDSTATGTRHIELEGEHNFRDLGGYETADGRTVKWGTVYRSGELPKLTDADVARLKELHIKTVVNFLTPVELEATGEDRLPDGAETVSVPIRVGDDLAEAGHDAQQTGDFSKLPPALNSEVHEILVVEAKAQYATLLREIAKDDNRPILFHCSHGVHRTGTGAAILLWSLGVPWETVREDYLLSNTFRHDAIQKSLAKLQQLAAEKQGIEPNQVDMTNAKAFLILEGSYIDATRDHIVAEYGSIDAYLRDGLGLTEAEIESLRETLLE